MYNFSEFVKECKNLNTYEIYLKISKERDLAESAKISRAKDSYNYFKNISYCSKLRQLGGILFNPNIFTLYKKTDKDIIEFIPILVKIKNEYIHSFLKENFQEYL